MTDIVPQVRDDARLAGRVSRYHTWPHIKEQSVAEHSWQLLRILLCIWPDVPAHVMAYVVRHDCGEIKTGDAPYPVKANNPDIAGGMNRVEEESLQEQWMQGFLHLGPDVTADEKWAVKLAEFIEMWEWGEEEKLLGNVFARLVALRCRKVVEERLEQCWLVGTKITPTDEEQFKVAIAARASQYVKKRIALWEL